MANFTTFSVQDINGNNYDGIVSSNSVLVEVPYGVDKSALIIDYTLSEVDATVNIAGIPVNVGDTLDFTNSITFTIVDNLLAEETSTVTVVTLANTEALIKSFEIPTLNIFGVIRDTIGTIIFIMPEGTNVTALTPEIIISDNASIVPDNNVVQDFTTSIEYEVTSESLATKKYLVTFVESPDHNNDTLTIYRMLLNRLPFVQDTEKNKQLASERTVEIMYEMENCFKVSLLEDGTYDNSRIGQEMYYNIPQKSVIADILSMQLLMTQAIKLSGGYYENGEHIEPSTTFIKEAEAGSVSVTYEQFDVEKKAVIAMDTNTIYNNFKGGVVRKLSVFGCMYVVGEDGCLHVCNSDNDVLPFYVESW